MKTLDIGAGDTFFVTIPLDKPISQYVNIEAALYTDKNKPVKFSYVEKVGYNKLNIGDSTSQLKGILLSTQCDKMNGLLVMEVAAYEVVDGVENIGKSKPTYVKDLLGNIVQICENVL